LSCTSALPGSDLTANCCFTLPVHGFSSTKAPAPVPVAVTHSAVDSFFSRYTPSALPTGTNWKRCLAPASQAASRRSQLEATPSTQALSAVDTMGTLVVVTFATAWMARCPLASAEAAVASSNPDAPSPLPPPQAVRLPTLAHWATSTARTRSRRPRSDSTASTRFNFVMLISPYGQYNKWRGV